MLISYSDYKLCAKTCESLSAVDKVIVIIKGCNFHESVYNTRVVRKHVVRRELFEIVYA